MKKKLSLLMGCLVWVSLSVAQQGDRDAAIGMLKQLSQRFQQTPQLSFEVQYRYTSEADPHTYLDSLKGSFKIDGDRYWYLLDSTEMLCGDKYVVVLYREDKLMYLSLPGTKTAAGNPMAILDSFLAKTDGIHFKRTVSAPQTTITISFDKPGAYKSLEYDIDNRTGLLARMISVVKSEQLYDPSVRSKVSPQASYAVIETLFTHYRERSFDAGLFNTNRYFKKEGNAYVAIPPYNRYKIFLGNPGL